MEDNKKETNASSFLLSSEQSRQKGASVGDDDLMAIKTTVDINNSSNMETAHDDQVDPSMKREIPFPTAAEIATALQSLPNLFFHRIASRVLEVGMDGEQLMGLVYSVLEPSESCSTHFHELNDTETISDEEVKESSSSFTKPDMEQSRDEEGGEDVSFDPASLVLSIRPDRDFSASSDLPTPEELAAVLQLGPGKYFQQLALHVSEMGIDGKQLKEFIFSFVPHIPMNVIQEHMLPLLDRVSWNRVCSMNKEIHDASRKMTPPWPKKRLQAGSPVRPTVFTPDGRLLACGCEDGIIRIWDRMNGQCNRLEEGHTGFINSLSFSIDGKTLASGSNDGAVRLWNLTDNSCRILEGSTVSVLSVTFAPYGLSLASGSFDGSIRIWDILDGTCTKVLRDERMDCVCSLAFSPDGTTLVSGGSRVIQDEDGEEDEFGIILLWDLSRENTGSTLFYQSQERTSDIFSIAYSPDGQYLAAGSSDSKVRLWNVAHRSWQSVFEGHSDFIQSVCFSPNGKILVSASDDRSVVLWDVDAGDGSCLLDLTRHHDRTVTSVVFSPDGQTLASGSVDGTVRLWNPFEESTRDESEIWERVLCLWNATC
jgi:WD40 repeat protein